jgi:hypothetical protein
MTKLLDELSKQEISRTTETEVAHFLVAGQVTKKGRIIFLEYAKFRDFKTNIFDLTPCKISNR